MQTNSEAHDVYITGLKNAHAMEKQALSIMQPQVSRLEHYPQVKQRLEQHIKETEDQVDRLDRLLESVDSSASGLKDTFLSAFGGMASLGHATAGDEILKNSFANYAFENYEIAAYKALITSAKACGEQQALGPLEETLREEKEMADWIDSHLDEVTQAYLSLRERGEDADI